MWIAQSLADIRARLLAVLPKGSVRARFAGGTFWALVGTMISQGLGLGVFVFVARLLGKVSFGELGMIRSTVGMLGVFAGFGLGLTATKHVAELLTKDRERAGRIIGLTTIAAAASGIALSVIMFVAAPVLAARTISAPHLAAELRIGCGLLFVTALDGAQTGALAGFEAFRTIAKVNLARGILSFPITVAAVQFWGLRGAVVSLVAVGAVGWAINRLALRAECRRHNIVVSYRGLGKELPLLFQFALPALIVGGSTQPVAWVVRAIVVNGPDGYAEMGLFTAAFAWTSLIQFVSANAARVGSSVLSSLKGAGEMTSYRRGFRAVFCINVGSSLLIAAPLMLLPATAMGLFGRGFAGGDVCLLLVAASSVLGAATVAIRTVFVSQGKLWWQVLFSVVWGVALIGSLAAVFPKTASGLGASYLTAFAVVLMIEVVSVRNLLRFQGSGVEQRGRDRDE